MARSAATPSSPSVKEALRALEAAHQVRHGDDGYRIPTFAEDDWRLRNGISPEARRLASALPGSAVGILAAAALARSSTPRPSRRARHPRPRAYGGRDVPGPSRGGREGLRRPRRRAAHAQPAGAQARLLGHRATDAIDRETVELFRSKEMPRGRSASTGRGHARPHRRGARSLRRHGDELRRLLKAAALGPHLFSGATTAAPATAQSTWGRLPPACSAPCCPMA